MYDKENKEFIARFDEDGYIKIYIEGKVREFYYGEIQKTFRRDKYGNLEEKIKFSLIETNRY